MTGQDSANFLFFLQELRAALPQGALITAATQVWPFADENGNPMGDVSAFAKVLDWILIMNYDIWGCEFAEVRDAWLTIKLPSMEKSPDPTLL